MVLHKNVNGARIQLSPEEEAKTRAEWVKNEEESAQEGQSIQNEIAQMRAIIKKLTSPLTPSEEKRFSDKLINSFYGEEEK